MDIKNSVRKYLSDLLHDLEFIEETSHHHPEESVLVHSLQVFELAYHACNDSELWAAALLHDVGKSIDGKHHASIGADLLKELLSPRIVWLVEHHLDLLKTPKRTRRNLKNDPLLPDLEALRHWDLQGRVTNKSVCSIEFAVDQLFLHHSRILLQSTDTLCTRRNHSDY